MNKSIFRISIICFIVCTTSIFYIGCEKPTETEEKDKTPALCTNGIFDPGELDIDCGGDCKPCGDFTAPCAPDSNTASLTGFPNVSFTHVLCNIQHRNYTMTCTGPNGDMYITLADEAPTVDRVYYFKPETGPSAILNYGQAIIQMNKSFSGSFYASSGKLYVAIKNGKVEVTFCNITFNGDQTAGDFKGSGRVICK